MRALRRPAASQGEGRGTLREARPTLTDTSDRESAFRPRRMAISWVRVRSAAGSFLQASSQFFDGRCLPVETPLDSLALPVPCRELTVFKHHGQVAASLRVPPVIGSNAQDRHTKTRFFPAVPHLLHVVRQRKPSRTELLLQTPQDLGKLCHRKLVAPTILSMNAKRCPIPSPAKAPAQRTAVSLPGSHRLLLHGSRPPREYKVVIRRNRVRFQERLATAAQWSITARGPRQHVLNPQRPAHSHYITPQRALHAPARGTDTRPLAARGPQFSCPGHSDLGKRSAAV